MSRNTVRSSRLRRSAPIALAAALAAGVALPAAAQTGTQNTDRHSGTTASVSDGRAQKVNKRTVAALNETVLWSENFDKQADATGFSKIAPKGWTINSSGFSTGEARWAGWAFTNIRDWTWAVGTDERHWFTGAHNTFAVVESNHQRLAERDRMTTALTTPAIAVKGENTLNFRFDSHYGQGKAPQSAAVYVSFDGGAKQDLLRLDEDRYSAHESLSVKVPAKAKNAQFTFSYEKGRNDKWWGVDNVELVRSASDVEGTPVATFDVLSDLHIQGGEGADAHRSEKYVQALELFAKQKDKAGALLLNGDQVEVGQAADYDAAEKLFAAHPHASGKVLMSSGNHEFLGKEGSDAYQDRFLKLAGRDVPWGEVDVNGIPALVISTEYYSDRDRAGVEPYVKLGDQQLAWLESRLAHYAKAGTPVILMNHHPLPQTVSETHSAWNGNDFYDLSALNTVIAKYNNVVYFSGHTHMWLGLNDWWGTYRVNGSGNPGGFPVFNTGAVLNAYVPEDDHESTQLEGDHATGLRVKVYRDRVRVEAWNVLTGEMMKYQDVPVTTKFAGEQ